MVKEVITIINKSRSVPMIYGCDDQLLVVCDLFGDNLVNFNTLFLELLGDALRVPEYQHGEGVHQLYILILGSLVALRILSHVVCGASSSSST